VNSTKESSKCVSMTWRATSARPSREEEAKLNDEMAPVVVGEDGKAAAAERAEEKRRQYLGRAPGLTLVHSSHQPEPFYMSLEPFDNPSHPTKLLTLSCKVDECKPLEGPVRLCPRDGM